MKGRKVTGNLEGLLPNLEIFSTKVIISISFHFSLLPIFVYAK